MDFPPLTFTDFSLLLIVGAIILLITAEVISPQYGLNNLAIDRKKLRYAALAMAIAFLIVVALKLAFL